MDELNSENLLTILYKSQPEELDTITIYGTTSTE